MAKSKRKNPTGETPQESIWTGSFGRDYTDRNTLDIKAIDELCRNNYGLSRSEIVESFLRSIPKQAKILEIGCNAGNQLLMLKHLGWSNLSGIELQRHALSIAQSRLPGVTLESGSALSLPWEDDAFDLVFTSGVLIHVSPRDLPRVMDEMYRVTAGYIWCTEYYAPQVTEIPYRDHYQLLWKMDYARQFMERFPGLELVQERRLRYVDNENVDTVFLLRKSAASAD